MSSRTFVAAVLVGCACATAGSVARFAGAQGAPGADAELKGLGTIGLVVESPGPQAAGCGLSQALLEAAVTKSLAGGGIKARQNADEDTFLYVHVTTSTVTGGLCVSRYDTFLYSFATATLSHQTKPILAQVQVIHKGGLAGGTPASHGEAVVRGVTQQVDEIASRIRNANR